MKVFCYFVEPASYTLDLASNVYDKHNIDYVFIKSKAFAESNLRTNKNFLDKKSLFFRIRYVYNVYGNNDLKEEGLEAVSIENGFVTTTDPHDLQSVLKWERPLREPHLHSQLPIE